MGAKPRTILTLNVTEGSGGKRIARGRYDSMKAAILESVPADAAGIPFKELPAAVGWRIDPKVFAGASIGWYAATVKLDLEARGLIERVPGAKPQRLRRADRPGSTRESQRRTP